MTLIAGVDLGGRKAAVAVLENGELQEVTDFEEPVGYLPKSLWVIARQVYAMTKWCDAIFVEEPLIGRSVSASLSVTKMYGAVLAVHGQGDAINVLPVGNKTWKRELLQNGNAAKPEIRSWLELNYPAYAEQCGASQDRIDATCIGLYGARIHERSASLAKL